MSKEELFARLESLLIPIGTPNEDEYTSEQAKKLYIALNERTEQCIDIVKDYFDSL